MTGAVSGRRVLAVSELVRSLQGTLDDRYRAVWVSGEVSGVHRAPSGHVYFVLKDDAAQLSAVAFRAVAARLAFDVVEGLAVVLLARVGIYPVRGQLQLYVEEMEPLGAGALRLAFDQLRARLEAEGLFDVGRKRPLPAWPAGVGLVTSRDGAAIRDMCRVLRDRWPMARVVLRPVAVQGAEAAPDVAAGIGELGAVPGIDVLVVGRGGGSLEDLWAFNTEVVARAIAAAPVPVVSAVGHESDVTIADLVADVRAATPTAGAALVVPDRRQVGGRVGDAERRLGAALARRMASMQDRLQGHERVLGQARRQLQGVAVRVDDLAGRLRRGLARRTRWDRRALRMLEARFARAAGRLARPAVAQQIAHLDRGLVRAMEGRLDAARQRLAGLVGKVDVLSPLGSLARGYAVVRRPATGEVVRDARTLSHDEVLELLLAQGRARVRVTEREW